MLGHLLVLGFLGAPLSAVPGAVGEWRPTPLPVYNARVRAVAPAPSNAAQVYIAAFENGVYRTDDVGANWTPRSGGLPLSVTIHDLAVSPLDPLEVLGGAHGVVYRTTDGGDHWIASGESFGGGDVRTLIIHAESPSLALAGVTGGTARGIYRSTDAGLTWAEVSTKLGAVDVRDLSASPADPDEVIAATGGGCAITTDAGSTWRLGAADNLQRVSWGASATRIYGITDEFVRSDDAGDAFFPIPFPFEGFESVAISPNPEIEGELIGALWGYGFSLPVNPVATRIWRSTNGGASWRAEHNGEPFEGGPPIVTARDPANANALWLGEQGNHGGGLLRSTDGGNAWTTRVTGIRNFEARIVRGDHAGTQYVAWEKEHGGLARYEANGSSEQWPWYGWLGQWGLEWDLLEVNARTPNLLFQYFQSHWADLGGSQCARSSDGGETWSPTAWSNWSGIEEIATNHGTGDVVYVRGSSWFSRSEDGGEHETGAGGLSRPGEPPPWGNPRWTVLDPSNPFRLFALSTDGVHWSEDGAETWELRSSGLPVTGPGRRPWALFMRPSDSNFLQVLYTDGRIFRTMNGGLAWSAWSSLPIVGAPLVDATWDPRTGDTFAATDGEGVVSTLANFDTSGLPDVSPLAVHFDPMKGLLFAGTSNAGLLQQRIFSRATVPAPDAHDDGDSSAPAFTLAPNPVRWPGRVEIQLPESGSADQLDVYDLRGRRVRRLILTPSEVAESLSWNGRDDEGRMVPAGVYFLRLAADAHVVSRRITVLR